MNLDKQKILNPNSDYERHSELMRLFEKQIELTQEDLNLLNACKTESYESIGIIGCLLKENSNINNARLLIASLHQYNDNLVDRAIQILNRTDTEIKTLIEQLSIRFIQEADELSEYENKVYFILFELLSDLEETE